MTTRKKLLLAAIALLLLGLLTLALWPAPIPVSASEATRGAFMDTVEDEGKTRLRDPYVVSAPISGYMQRLDLEEGDKVAAGDTLLSMAAMPAPGLDVRSHAQAQQMRSAAEARLEAARAERDAADAALRFAEAELLRVRTLHARESVAGETVERAQAARDRARAEQRATDRRVEVARFELEAARQTLEIADGTQAPEALPRLALRAPAEGVVLRRHRWSEGPVQAGEPLLEIGDPARIEVLVEMLSMDATRVAPGMPVEIARWGGDALLEGRVRRVAPAGFTEVSALGVEEQRVAVWVEIISPHTQWERLGDGYRVEARFILWQGEDVLQIPSSALFRAAGQWRVFVISEGRARMREVQPGRSSGLRTQVLDGLRAGEIVITHPGDHITEGSRVAADIASR